MTANNSDKPELNSNSLITLSTYFCDRGKMEWYYGFIPLVFSIIITIFVYIEVSENLRVNFLVENSVINLSDQMSNDLKWDRPIDIEDIKELKTLNTNLINKISELSAYQFLNVSSNVIFLIVGFFLIQIFLKLYRFKIMMSKHYYALSDAFKILSLNPEQEKITISQFSQLIESLSPTNFHLDTPESPKLVDFSKFFKS